MNFQTILQHTSGTFHIEKSSNVPKNEEKPCSTCLIPTKKTFHYLGYHLASIGDPS